MDINDYRAAIKSMIEATNDEALLSHWKNHIEKEFEEYKQRNEGAQDSTTQTKEKKDNEGYVILESGLGIDE